MNEKAEAEEEAAVALCCSLSARIRLYGSNVFVFSLFVGLLP